MTKPKGNRMARPRLSRRSSGWWDWDVCDSFGGMLEHPTINMAGIEKAKCHALEAAGQAAKQFNAQYTPKTEPRRPRVQPKCSKAGFDTEIFSR